MRRFEMREGTSSKFWEIEVRGSDVVVRFGRIGTDGQSKTKRAANAAAAQKEAEKLVREKLGKGYEEVGAGAGGKKAAPTKTAKAPPAKAPAKASAPITGTFAFTAEVDALFERGFPHLRTLSEEVVTPAKATSEAKKGIDAIDPYFPVTIPREVARRYLRGYVHAKFDPKTKEAIAKDDGPIDERWLAEILERKCSPTKTLSYGGETYDFRLAEVMFLFEAFLGTEVVADALAAHLLRARDNPKWWGDMVDHHHTEARRLVEVLGWMRLRMPAARWKKLVEPLRGSKAPKLPEYSAALRALADDKEPTDELALAMQRRDPKPLRALLTKHGSYWSDPHFYFVTGKDALLSVDTKGLPRLPKWWQLRLVDELGTIQAPGTVRVMAALLASRSAGEAAAAWLRAHEPFAKESLGAIDRASADAVRAILEGKAAPAPAKVDKRALEKEVKAIFTGLEKALAAHQGDAKKERATLDQAFSRYAEIRAALGDVIPEAYFTHHLSDVTPRWKVDQATKTRWIDLAVEAASG